MVKRYVSFYGIGRETVLMGMASFALFSLMAGICEIHSTGPIELSNLKLRQNPNWIYVMISVFLFFMIIFISKQTRRIPGRKLPNITGLWSYEVTDYKGLKSHSGKCIIIEDQDFIFKFVGQRIYEYDDSKNRIYVTKYWESEWTSFDDIHLRIGYTSYSKRGLFRVNLLNMKNFERNKLITFFYNFISNYITEKIDSFEGEFTSLYTITDYKRCKECENNKCELRPHNEHQKYGCILFKRINSIKEYENLEKESCGDKDPRNITEQCA